jgi:6-phosphofructokinase 1
MRMINPADLRVPTLGHCTVESPIQRHWAHADETEIFVSDEGQILLDYSLTSVVASIARIESALAAFELAGPRRKLFFDPADSSCAIVTCGGLRGQAYLRYGIRTILGIQCGYEGRSFGRQIGLYGKVHSKKC